MEAERLANQQGVRWYYVNNTMKKIWLQMPPPERETLLRGGTVIWNHCCWQPEMFHFEAIELKSQCGCYWSSHKLFCKCKEQ